MSFIIAVDTGGTFTDLVVFDIKKKTLVFSKGLTSYNATGAGLLQSIDRLGVDLAHADIVKLGTTLVINTLIQRSGAATALVTTRGFRDVLELRRGNRAIPFDIRYSRDPVLVPRDLRFELDERIAADGSILKPVDSNEVAAQAEALDRSNIAAVAVSFMNAYANPVHEAAVVEQLRAMLPGVYVTAGTEVSAEWYEYERTATAAANAYVGPILNTFLDAVQSALSKRSFRGRTFMMGSNGGLCSIERARRVPVALVESGPAGGCIGAAAYADAIGLDKVIAFDMGGTTAKCALVENGQFRLQNPYYVGGIKRGFPIRGTVIDIVEVGAGGGSIAAVDAHGRLTVGPRSAGSTPGPVAYGRGGREPTVTDANIVLGRIDPAAFLGGEISLDAAAAGGAITERVADRLGLSGRHAAQVAAQGIIDVGAMIMAGAIKRITIEQGLDPRDFSLVVFGGGGPLHGVELARQLNIGQVIVPPAPGVFSALGMLLADARIDDLKPFLKSVSEEAIAGMQSLYDDMAQSISRRLREETGADQVIFERQAEMRYRGQKQSLRVQLGNDCDVASLRRRFVDAHQRRYGHAESSSPIEFVSLVLSGVAALAKPALDTFRPTETSARQTCRQRRLWSAPERSFRDVNVYARTQLAPGEVVEGPAIVEEYGSATLIGSGDRLVVGAAGEMRISVGA